MVEYEVLTQKRMSIIFYLVYFLSLSTFVTDQGNYVKAAYKASALAIDNNSFGFGYWVFTIQLSAFNFLFKIFTLFSFWLLR